MPQQELLQQEEGEAQLQDNPALGVMVALKFKGGFNELGNN